MRNRSPLEAGMTFFSSVILTNARIHHTQSGSRVLDRFPAFAGTRLAMTQHLRENKLTCYTSCVHFFLRMKTSTRTRSSTAISTKVALGIAIGASAAFAAVSLSSIAKDPISSYQLPVKGGSIMTREECQQQCVDSYTACTSKRSEKVCYRSYDACSQGCFIYPPAETLPGYIAPGDAAPGYTAPGYEVPGYITPGYTVPGEEIAPGNIIPPTLKRLPPWEANDNPPDPKSVKTLPVAPTYKK